MGRLHRHIAAERLAYETSIDMPAICLCSSGRLIMNLRPAAYPTSRLSLNRQRPKVRLKKQLMLLVSTGCIELRSAVRTACMTFRGCGVDAPFELCDLTQRTEVRCELGFFGFGIGVRIIAREKSRWVKADVHLTALLRKPFQLIQPLRMRYEAQHNPMTGAHEEIDPFPISTLLKFSLGMKRRHEVFNLG